MQNSHNSHNSHTSHGFLTAETPRERLRIRVRGAVQGVGFRPYVFRLAGEHGVDGWVGNDRDGVLIEIEGARKALDEFLVRLPGEVPAPGRIHGVEPVWLDPCGHAGFRIRASDAGGGGGVGTEVLPDIAMCRDCRRELMDPGDRRFRYPFLNCSHCGPRYTIVESLPYDRSATSMRRFTLCARCRAEYGDPGDRRFHAQPTACPECGPQLAWRDGTGVPVAAREEALAAAVLMLRSGGIVAVLGIGGFHLMVRADREDGVVRLRARKAREAKPLALMFPDRNAVAECCRVSPLEWRLLESQEAPIVLLHRRGVQERGGGGGLAPSVAPGNPYLGVMLPYSPLHQLLLSDLGVAVVATSGNRGDEPICTGVEEGLERLGGIADGFLVHDRPIVRAVDDSIVRVVAGRELVLRRARGYVPVPVPVRGIGVGFHGRRPVLAMGAQSKSAVAFGEGGSVVLGQHLGDLDSIPARAGLERCVGDLGGLLGWAPAEVVVDGHPGYASTLFGRGLGLQVREVQHHHAHVLGCVAENRMELPVLGVAWDGTGDGMDGTVWGGEFLRVGKAGCERFASLRPFRLAGGEAAVREPRRAALGVLHVIEGESLFRCPTGPGTGCFRSGDLPVLRRMLERGIQSPWTSSMGRVLDAVASLTGLCQVNRFEGEGAMALESAADGVVDAGAYAIGWAEWPVEGGVRPVWTVDWEPAVRGVLEDRGRGVEAGVVASRFLGTLVEMIVAVAQAAGEGRVGLTGGCFQNRLLSEMAIDRLRREGFQPFWHRRVPPNDGGIALGQVMAAFMEQDREQA